MNDLIWFLFLFFFFSILQWENIVFLLCCYSIKSINWLENVFFGINSRWTNRKTKIDFCFVFNWIRMKTDRRDQTEEWTIVNGMAKCQQLANWINIECWRIRLCFFFIVLIRFFDAIEFPLISNNICASGFPSFVAVIDLMSTDCWL